MKGSQKGLLEDHMSDRPNPSCVSLRKTSISHLGLSKTNHSPDNKQSSRTCWTIKPNQVSLSFILIDIGQSGAPIPNLLLRETKKATTPTVSLKMLEGVVLVHMRRLVGTTWVEPVLCLHSRDRTTILTCRNISHHIGELNIQPWWEKAMLIVPLRSLHCEEEEEWGS